MVTAIFAILAFRKQSAEVSLLQKQAQRDIDLRRLAQASRVFAWQERRQSLPGTDPGPAETSGLIFAHVKNASDQPVYDVEFRWLLKERARPYQTARTEAPLGPGAEREIEFKGHPDIGLDMFSVAVCFRDASGVSWLRRPNGHLEEDSSAED